jgi:WhiB family redox-sensing transcriptional regulator
MPVKAIPCTLAGVEIAEPRQDHGAWRDLALCAQVDPELWFSDSPWQYRAARAICGECPVRAECLAFALEHNEQFGMWGGLVPQERRQLHRALRHVAAADVEGEAA